MIRIAALIAFILVGGCDARPDRHAQRSVTVQLPPARPPASTPGFSFSNAAQPTPQGATERQ